ncbi:hypothetical protein TVAG_318960 [Trichomonas vaginalis G3]|uniref:Uncharacterized protein n=1 Tax=Trichomonas vaginalis (strain ATCC PRA-98 / G3) TaxID=412133 RepID=A2EP74_TRIV3|nr:hypothetical protein TVAGG3_0178340 [Trichomonas vaginalis G3]EAY05541.1 hypothetical protein TVAG_318960 [Trichomonas vaginalis G3]KAI5549100.1 hypothetical protein TVAGG3_0178340 [Trichomonas vaginalis G3]|eukprot:XP_001317764.1 hypothetical protein [Trichomonas vaginalis G3]
MSIIEKLINSKDKIPEIKSLWDLNCVEAIPPLIYLSLTDNDDVKHAATSLLYKIASTAQKSVASTRAMPYPIVKDQELTKRQIVKQPKSLAVPGKSITFAFHVFAMSFSTLDKQYMTEFLSLLEKILSIPDYNFQPRFYLDVLIILPLYFETDNEQNAKKLMQRILADAEKNEMMDVVIAINSLLELF